MTALAGAATGRLTLTGAERHPAGPQLAVVAAARGGVGIGVGAGDAIAEAPL
jgi:hypothetical protein